MNGITEAAWRAAARRDGRDGYSVFVGAFLAIDIVDSSTALLADDEWRGFMRLRKTVDALAARIHAHDGTTLKCLGDGLEAVFESPADALSCARHLLISPVEQQEERLGVFRIGLTAGQMIRYSMLDASDVFGHCVVIAAKLAKRGRAPGLMCPIEFPGTSQLALGGAGLRCERFQAWIGGMSGRYWRISKRDNRTVAGVAGMSRADISLRVSVGAENYRV